MWASYSVHNYTITIHRRLPYLSRLLCTLFFGAFAKLRNATMSFVMSVSPHGRTRLPLDGISWNLIVEYFSKIYRENWSSIKILREKRVLYMKTCAHLWQHLAQIFLKWEMFQTNAVQKIKIHILCLITVFPKSCRLWDNVEKCGRAGRATDDNIIQRMRFACWITKATNTLRICNNCTIVHCFFERHFVYLFTESRS
jgi:hypothetical protein